jgi:putative transposase
METALEGADMLGVSAICDALGLPRSSYYRQKQPRAPTSKRRAPPRALSSQERDDVLDVLHSERFRDVAPAEVVFTLADEGRYLCSTRTMYRILEANDEVRERRDQLRHPSYAKPELVATAPNQVWSWDITKLKGPEKWLYYYLYVVLDIYSRYVVGWMVAEHENAALAKRLIEESYDKHGVEPGTLVLHADRGSPMKAKTTAQLLADLGVERSHSRPHVSNDNPFSESQFKTLKYCPDFPKRFGGPVDALAFCRVFFPRYNNDHRHSALAYLTPRQVHYGEADEALKRQHAALLAAYKAHPERFVRGPPAMPKLPEAVWINPPKVGAAEGHAAGLGVPETGLEASP